MNFSSKAECNLANTRKIILGLTEDVRIIIIKLADRLHNMRTLEFKSEFKQKENSLETMEIFVPLAYYIGAYRIKSELEDISFRYLKPDKYLELLEKLDKSDISNSRCLEEMLLDINDILSCNSIPHEIKVRTKNIYGIYKRLEEGHKMSDIHDLLSLKIMVDEIKNCYVAMGLIHSRYKPINDKFKDYICNPKTNLYSSLHTTVFGPDEKLVQTQIRTFDMDKVASFGLTAYWDINKGSAREVMQEDLRTKSQLFKSLTDINLMFKDNQDFVTQIKGELFADKIYIYTSNGRVIELPKGSNIIDFACYSGIEHILVGAKVNDELVPLDYELKTGDIISIKTNKNSFGPSENWLKIAKTSHARHKIKNFLNRQNKDMLIVSGKSNIDEEFRNNKITSYTLNDEFAKTHFSKNNINSLEELYIDVGKGNISSKTVYNKYVGEENQKTTEEQLARQMERNQRILTTHSQTGIIVEGLVSPQLKFGNCCMPIPGDPIVGYVSKGSGIVVHHRNCKNAKIFQQERLIDLSWASNIDRKYPVSIKIYAMTNINLLVEIMNTISLSNMNLLAVNAINNNNLETVVKLKVLTKDLPELEKFIYNLKKIKYIYNIERDNL
jgi:GTP pyrophosphokinase